MKRSIYTLGISMLFITPMFMSCESAAQQEQKARESRAELDQITKDEEAKKAKEEQAEEWAAFKADTDKRIAANTERIAEIRVKKAKPGRALDGVYAAQIDGLQQRNNDLQVRLNAYEKENSDWEKFKREFNHDMDELGKALEDLGKDNAK